jgi:hypothetical protein|tara:strand:+ start:83 stop:328 length:246 start_codon:yes stop_codon:yes gene_type:complete
MDARELCKRVVKYVLEGLVVAIAAILLPKTKPDFEAVIALALVAASTFAIVDTMMPSLSTPLNMGVGFGIGANLVNFPGGY